MRYCDSCGAYLDDEQKECPYCGESTRRVEKDAEQHPGKIPPKETADSKIKVYEHNAEEENEPQSQTLKWTEAKVPDRSASSTGLSLLGFFFPLAGFILFFFWYKKKPVAAKCIIKGAIVGTVTFTVLLVVANIVRSIFAFVAMFSANLRIG